MDQLREFISGNDRGVIFLDEVNKLMSSHLGQSAWTADVFTECIAFLDQDSRLDAMGLSGLVEKLRKHFIICGVAVNNAQTFAEYVAPRDTFTGWYLSVVLRNSGRNCANLYGSHTPNSTQIHTAW
jgi:hypothetical protein